ncbi:MAG: SAM-dependent methyltransferase [Desulfobaccales bacterium]
MPPDFRDASERHWDDSGHLFTNTRLANADHLLGLASECALKAVMLGLGMTLRPDGAPADWKYRQHIKLLWDEFKTFAQNRSAAHYAAMLGGNPNPFDNWDVNQRYGHRTQFSEPVVRNHHQAAEKTMRVLKSAILNGDVA